MANNYPNIETRRVHGHAYRVGYNKNGSVRIYGDSEHGYNVLGRYFRTLAEVSKFLSETP